MRDGALPLLFVVVDKVAAHPVRAEADGVEGAARLRLVLGMAVEVTQLLWPVGKLALAAVLAHAALGEGATQFSLVARRRRRRGGAGVQRRRGNGVALGMLDVDTVPSQTRRRGAARLNHANGSLAKEACLCPGMGISYLGEERAVELLPPMAGGHENTV